MSLRQTAITATRWTTAVAIVRTGLQLLQLMILARLLVPSDFGLMAMASVMVAVAGLIADCGLGSALIHFPRPDHRTLSTIYWVNLGVSCFLALGFAALAWPIARAYSQPDLIPVLLLLGLSFPLNALGHIYRVLAEKELRFRTLAQQEITAALAGFSIAIVLACYGAGIYALVAATLVSAATISALAWFSLSEGLRPRPEFCLVRAKPFLVFGMHRLGDRAWTTLRMQADIFLAGVYASPAAVAIYATPRDQCLRVSNSIINPIVTRVSLPVMARLQQDSAVLRGVYLKILRLTSSLNFPLYAVVALFPDDIVALLLGPQWSAATPYFQLFAIWALIRSTGNPSGSLLYAVGMVRRTHLWNATLFFGVIPFLWGAMAAGGLAMLAWAMLVSQLVIFVLAWRFLVRPACGAGFGEYLSSLSPPFIATLLSAALAMLASYSLPSPWRLLVGASVMAAAYLLISWWINRAWLSAVLELLKPAWRRSR